MQNRGLGEISIIIPTLNEADFIGYLLFSLSRQTYKDFEVIVSDGNSEDQTREIVYGFKKQLPDLTILTSKKRSPAVQRNKGVEKSRFERLLFLDADVILPPDFLQKNLVEIEDRGLDLAHPTSFPMTKRIFDQYFYMLSNLGFELMANILPLAGGWTLFSQKGIHQKIKGFDEKMKFFGEDGDYVMRAVKGGAKFGVTKSSSPYISVRRFDAEGRGNLLPNMLLQGFYFNVFGKHRAQKFFRRMRYPFGNFGTVKKYLDKERKVNPFLNRLNKKQFGKLIASFRKLLGDFS